MSSRDDMEFLAVLVHRGLLTKDAAAAILRASGAGSGTVDECLVASRHFTDTEVAGLRATRGEDRPQVPGHEVFERIGVGATANVYRARERASMPGGGGRETALKILHQHLADNIIIRDRLIGEGKLLMELDHPSIVKGYRVAHFTPRGGGETSYLISMELVRGKTLLEHLSAKKTFDEDTALRIIIDVARALDYLRSRGIVHRDVKPGNLMIGERGEVKLIDLGFATETKQAEDHKTEAAGSKASDMTVGTIHYLSPEQARGEGDLDVRSDIYALGVTLFHLTIGELPFSGDAPSEVIRKHVLEELSSPALKSRGISPHLHYFIQKMMVKDRDFRYRDPEDLIKDIERTVAGKKMLEFKPRR